MTRLRTLRLVGPTYDAQGTLKNLQDVEQLFKVTTSLEVLKVVQHSSWPTDGTPVHAWYKGESSPRVIEWEDDEWKHV